MKLLRSLACLFLTSLAFADLHQGDGVLTAMAGIGAPVTEVDFTDVNGGKDIMGMPGPLIGGQYLYSVAPRFALGVDLNYFASGERNSSKLLSPLANAAIRTNSFVGLAVAKLNFTTSGVVMPYFLTGLGLHRSSLKIDYAPAPGNYWLDTHTTEQRPLMNDAGNNFAWALAFGLDFPVNENLFLGLETRYQYLAEVVYHAQQNSYQHAVNQINQTGGTLSLLAKVGIRFGETTFGKRM